MATAQLVIKSADTAPYTPINIIENVFLGEGVEITGINYFGVDSAVGIFENGNNFLGLNRGIVLSTGNINNISMSSEMDGDTGFANDTIQDMDLENLAGININDISKYEISFIPTSDTLRFNYVFASEEYPEFNCENTNDAFGFFISGPNPSGGTYNAVNIALIPDPNAQGQFVNLPVTINNVNNGEDPTGGFGNCIDDFALYYNETPQGSAPIFNGYLDVFTAEAIVTPCEEYTIKIVIGDGKDDQFDSAVFLEEKSFRTNTLSIDVQNPGINGGISEGCLPGKVNMEISQPQTTEYIIELLALNDPTLPNIALPGIDYENIPNILSIPIGETSTELEIVPIMDGLIEDTEFIYIQVSLDVCNIDTLRIPLDDNTLNFLTLPDTIQACFNFVNDIKVQNTESIPEEDTRTFTSSGIQNLDSSNDQVRSPISVFGLDQDLLNTAIITNICIDTFIHRRLNDLSFFIEAPNGQLLELSSNNGARPNNDDQIDTLLNTCFTVNSTRPINNNMPLEGDMDLSNPNYTGQYSPEENWNNWFLPKVSPANGEYNLIVIDNVNQFNGQLIQWSITFNTEYKVDYSWFPKMGLIDCNCDSVTFKLRASQYYYLELTDSYGCSKLDSVWIEVDDLPMTPEVECEALSPSTVRFSWTNTPDFFEYRARINEKLPFFRTNINSTVLQNGFEVTVNTNSEVIVQGLIPEEEISFIIRAVNERGCVGFDDTITCRSQPCLGNVPVIDSIVFNQPECEVEEDIPIQIFATDPDGPLNYRINTVGSLTFENGTGQFEVPPGYWPVRVIDNDGCAVLDSVRIETPPPIGLTSQLTPITCNGEEDAQIFVVPEGENPPFQYVWSNNSAITDSFQINLGPGTYGVTITDELGCTEENQIVINNPPPISYSYQQIDTIDCLALFPGSATINITGGVEPFIIDWQNGIVEDIILNQTPGIQYFTITDSNNCIISDSSEIIQNITFDVSSISSELNCFTDSTGTAVVTSTQGSFPYSYQWDNGELTNEPIMLFAGVNTVTVTDNEGCVVIHTVDIPSPPKIEIDFIPVSPSCVGGSDGSLTVQINGGVGMPYDITWFDGSRASLVNNLEAGNYCVTVVDSEECEEVSCFNLPDAPSIRIDANVNPESCESDCNGSIDISTMGGSGNFNFAWSGPSNFNSLDQNLTDLCAGLYSLTITERNNVNCSETFEVEIGTASELEAFIQVNRFISCFGGEDGILLAVPEGGVDPYEYAWSNNVTSINVNAALNLSAGAYTLTITDANGCTSSVEQELLQPDSLELKFVNSDVLCFGENTGKTELTITGGTNPYSIEWETGDNGNELDSIFAGNYTVSVTDRLGCTTIDKTLILEPLDSIVIIPEISPVTCFGGRDGQISIFTENAAIPVSYSLDNENFKFDNTFVGLSAGEHTIYVIDDNDCTQELTIIIEQAPELDLDLGEPIVVLLGGAVTLNVVVLNNTGDLSYIWDAPNIIDFSCTNCPNPEVINILETFTAQVVVTDENGCTGREFINVFVDEEDRIFVPEIFTPNGDNINDRLNIFGSDDLFIESFKVYSRWGNLVYEGFNMEPNDPSNGWDGTFKGELAPTGTYTWTSSFILKSGDRAFGTGQTLLYN